MNQLSFTAPVPALPRWRRPDPRQLTGPLACLALVVAMSAISPRFFGANNFANIVAQGSVLTVLALGQMLVIITRGFDISVGAVAALASVVTAHALAPFGELNAILLGVLAGLAVGAINGYLIAYQGLQPIVVTLGATLAVRGLATALAESGEAAMLGPDSLLQTLGYSSLAGLPALVWLSAAVALLVWVISKWLPLGKWLYMVGGNPEAAALVGVPVRGATVLAYALCGALAAVAGMLLLARSGSALAIEGGGMELQAIAACVIGGIVLSGGSGSAWQAWLGALFIQALLNGLNLTGASPFISEMVLGVVIVSAGALDYVAGRFRTTVYNQETAT